MSLEVVLNNQQYYGIKPKLTEGKQYSEQELFDVLKGNGVSVEKKKVMLGLSKRGPLDLNYVVTIGASKQIISFNPIKDAPGNYTVKFESKPLY